MHGATPFDPVTGAISTPIYQSSTFRHPALFESTGFDYSRGLNPTRLELEKTLAALEHAEYGLAFSSGMAAVSAIIKLFSPGDHLIVSEDLYGGTFRLFNEYYAKYGFAFFLGRYEFDRGCEARAYSGDEGNFRRDSVQSDDEGDRSPRDGRSSSMDMQDPGPTDRVTGAGLLIVDNTFLSPVLPESARFRGGFRRAQRHEVLSAVITIRFRVSSRTRGATRLRRSGLSR